jgi:hypothetical protein
MRCSEARAGICIYRHTVLTEATGPVVQSCSVYIDSSSQQPAAQCQLSQQLNGFLCGEGADVSSSK